jgi:outer membrane protein OmpA-like peptidoglycan-associated protein
LPPQSRERDIKKRSSLHIGLRNKECKKPCQLSLKLIEEEVSAELLLTPIEEIILANKVILNPIYFDFDKSNITAQAAFELDKLVQLMIKYESIVIAAESHTDSRGSASYNLSLSDRRAKTTAQYVIFKGIDASRITGTGKGETTPNVDCGGNCTEDEHQLNRRSEFFILEGNPNDQ